MVEFIIWCVIEGSVASFLIFLGHKWEVIERWQEKAPCEKVWELLNCQFCTTFWLCVTMALVLSVMKGEWMLMLTPLVATRIGLRL